MIADRSKFSKNKKLSFNIKKSKYFNNIVSWAINVQRLRQKDDDR